MTACALIAAPKFAPPAGIPPITPGSAVKVIKSVHFSSAATAATPSGMPTPRLTTLLGRNSIAARRAEQKSEPGAVHYASDTLLRRLHAALPFPLTGAQQRAIGEIQADLATLRPMNRLLHGDVGSGKTIVALSAMLLAVEAGYQAAVKARTA